MSFVSRWRRSTAPRSSTMRLDLAVDGFPGPSHPAEADLFCRQVAMPGHRQECIDEATVGVVGCGGLGSWIAVGLARLGVRRLLLYDEDRFDRTNAPRQLMFPNDLSESKAHALARNVAPHMTNRGGLSAIAKRFELESVLLLRNDVTLLVIGVDNNRTRLEASRYGIQRQIPVAFGMLSTDGLRAQIFLQEPGGPCLLCVLPNVDPDTAAPCAAASIASCYLAAAHVLEVTVAAVCGIDSIPRWRETSLDGSTERAATPLRRPDCSGCGTSP
jgi:molybdopterin/thiamine biosynthesis adenylyltransferase